LTVVEALAQRGRFLSSQKPVLEAVVRDVRTFAMILRAIAFTPVRLETEEALESKILILFSPGVNHKSCVISPWPITDCSAQLG
jgi:hypothetical protein